MNSDSKSMKTDLFICTRSRCRWVGTDDQFKQVPSTRFKGLNATDGRCPLCNGRSFWLAKTTGPINTTKPETQPYTALDRLNDEECDGNPDVAM